MNDNLFKISLTNPEPPIETIPIVINDILQAIYSYCDKCGTDCGNVYGGYEVCPLSYFNGGKNFGYIFCEVSGGRWKYKRSFKGLMRAVHGFCLGNDDCCGDPGYCDDRNCLLYPYRLGVGRYKIKEETK